MKNKYYQNLFIHQLERKLSTTASPVDTLKKSLSKIQFYEDKNPLFEEIIDKLRDEDIEPFLDIVASQKRNSFKCIKNIVYKFKLNFSAYNRLVEIEKFNLRCQTSSECLSLREVPQVPENGLLNFCFYVKFHADLLETEIDLLEAVLFKIETLLVDFSNAETEEKTEFMQALKKIFLIIKVKAEKFERECGTTAVNDTDALNISKKDHERYSKGISSHEHISAFIQQIRQIARTTKDPVLIAMVDHNGRINGSKHEIQDLLLIDIKQIYNLSEERQAIMSMCIYNMKEQECAVCKNPVFIEKKRGCLLEINVISKILDDSIIENNTEMLCNILCHCKPLRNEKSFKFLLKLFIAKINNENEVKRSILKAIDLFDVSDEIETLVISFLKSIIGKDKNEEFASACLVAIPIFLKSKKTVFAAFVVLLQAFQTSKSSFFKIAVKNIVFKFKSKFESVIDLVSVFVVSGNLEGVDFHSLRLNAEGGTENDLKDDFWLFQKMEAVAELFSMHPKDFVYRYVYIIFNSVYPNSNFTREFVERNIKYVIVQNIISGSFSDQVDDVDIFVGVLFRGFLNVTELGKIFKPSFGWFIKKNLSHILFKIKSAYCTNLYYFSDFPSASIHDERSRCRCLIYKILRFILLEINIPLYFNYIWPYVEFFLNKEQCQCSSEFVEWVKQYCSNSCMIMPYLANPFDKIEDIPIHIENRIQKMLSDYFATYSISDHSAYTGQAQCMNSSVTNTSGRRNSFWNLKTLYDKFNLNFSSYESSYSDNLVHKHNCTSNMNISHSALSRHLESKMIPDEVFIENFIFHYKKNRAFKNKIERAYAAIPIRTKALFGNLKHAESLKNSKSTAPQNIPKTILETFLLKIDYEKQDLYAFTIQEFLKVIDEPFEKETEVIVEQFRHTRLEYKFDIEKYFHNRVGSSPFVLNLQSFRSFLESLFYFLYSSLGSGIHKNMSYFKYLILFDDSVLEYSVLCLIFFVHNSLSRTSSPIDIFANIETNNKSILDFLLKINSFVSFEIIPNHICLKYALQVKDFYRIIYCLESMNCGTIGSLEDISHSSDNKEKSFFNCLIQIAYYMVNDSIRVRAFNFVDNSCDSLNLYFDFLINKNYKAALECLKEIQKDCEKMEDHSKWTSLFKILKDILDNNTDLEIDNFIESEEFTGSNPLLLHVLKDMELLMKAFYFENRKRTSLIGLSNPEICSPQNSTEASFKLNKAIHLINERRKISENPDAILKIHKLISSKVDSFEFSDAVDFEIIGLLRKKKEFHKCEELLAKMILRKEHKALYELSLVKIDQRLFIEAKELLKRLLSNSLFDFNSADEADANSNVNDTAFAHYEQNEASTSGVGHNYSVDTLILYYKAALKLCEISKSSFLFESSILNLENLYMTAFLASQPCSQRITGSAKLPSLENYKKIHEAVYKKLNHPQYNEETAVAPIESFKLLQRLYFLAAKHFEKSNNFISIQYYFKSFNSNHEAIPRFFHMLPDIPKNHYKQLSEMVDIIISHHLSDLIPYYNQISTKLSFYNDSSSKFYKCVISNMMEKYPFQTFWNSLILVNSKKPEIREKATEIMEELSFDNRLLFKNILKFSERLTGIAKSQIKNLSLRDFPNVSEMLPCKINIPGQMTEINSMKNEIHTFHSLQMPKKITLIGENGKEYQMIVKFKDDLRKDSRFMDLDNLLNKLFDEGYYIRSYKVIPFTHDSGIIEFVPDLCNLKEIVTGYYDNINEAIYKFSKFKRVGGNNMGPLCSQFKPVFNKYLITNFSDPFRFYTARENYIKTYAIMNIVGWFMGLGDRHTENIHFDKNTGDTVHVDLNCIFDKAKSLEIPEKVPFRLTQNIIDGFGKLGVEGTYKHTMRYTLALLKDNRDVIQANLLSFVFDPLFEWARKKTEPTKIIDGMNHKLDFEDEDEKVQQLIEEATDINNLGSIYLGWMPFI